MENNDSLIQNNSSEQTNKHKRKPVVLLLILVILLGLASILGVMYYNLKIESKRSEAVLIDEKNKLEEELSGMYNEYNLLRTENDSINLKLEEQQSKIKRLLAINASNSEKIRLYKREMGTLREIMKSYIVQIDSLNQKNQRLIAENMEVRTKLRTVEKSKSELEQLKEELSSKVEIASTLTAKNITATPLNKNSKEKYKIDKVEKIRVCFTLRENKVISPGEKRIFLRISRPDNVVLASSAEDITEYNGQQVVFSAKRDIDYENTDIDVCIYWDKNEELIEGTYQVELIFEGSLIGISSFALK